MRIISILKPALFVYECVRLVILSITLVLQTASALPWMAFTANGALFPLMALFIWLDVSRYKPYMPLFIAGKCIGIFSLLGWFIVFTQVTMIQVSNILLRAELIFLSGDFIALAAILLIFMDVRKIAEEPKLIETEEK